MKHLTDEQLEESFKLVVKREREILHEVILHVREVERRRLYLKRNFGNMNMYLEKVLGYKGGSAQRRLDAARLAFDVPEVLEKIKEGTINLTDCTVLQKGIRQKQAANKVKITAEVKQEILQKMTTEKYPDKVVAQGLDLPVLFQTKIHAQKDESVRLEITLTKEDWENLKRIQELEGGSTTEIISKLLKVRIAKKDPLKKAPVLESSYMSKSAIKTGNKSATPSVKSTATVAPCDAASDRKYISISKRRFVFQRDRVCQHRDEHGKICGSSYRLEIDHIKPVCHGGTDGVSNLRLACSNHNKYLALQILGEKVMRPHLKL